jgi:Dolichyl-phosphate-mannose-protein mannosyltransferase
MGSSADYNENEIPASTQTQGAHPNGVSVTQSIADSDHVEVISPIQTRQALRPFSWLKWSNACKQVLPIYLAIHLAFLILTYLATLFSIPNFSSKALPLSSLWHSWFRWDSGHFTHIATYGYDAAWRTAFFPLFPLLERGLAFLTHDPFVAGLIVANLAGLVMLVVLFRLVQEDFDSDQAYRTVLYLSVFPTAFFFAAAYNESLFLCLALLSFYQMRHGHWWLAGMFGLLASLTRSVGLLLLVPFFYEYLRQHDFKLSKIRFDIISSISIAAGLGIFTLYCYLQFHDLLAFSHSQAVWHHELHGPWHGLIDSFMAIIRHAILSFDSVHNVIDLSAGLLMLILVFLCFVGPWKFSRDRWAYGLYAIITYLFSLLFPLAGGFPLASVSRYMLEIFPAFIVLAAIGKKQQFNLYYLTLSGAILSFMLLQFLTGGWIV